jgi:hypothetical protein
LTGNVVLLEVLRRQFGVYLNGFAPGGAGFFVFADRLEGVSQIGESRWEIGLRLRCQLVALGGFFWLSGGLQQETQVLGEFQRAVSQRA